MGHSSGLQTKFLEWIPHQNDFQSEIFEQQLSFQFTLPKQVENWEDVLGVDTAFEVERERKVLERSTARKKWKTGIFNILLQ